MQAEAMAAMAQEIGGLRTELKDARKAAEVADQQAIEERRKLRLENEDLRVQIFQIKSGVKRVENIVANPTSTPDPDATKGVA